MKILYRNEFGLGFYWMKSGKVLDTRIQLVFRDMGFYLTKDELQKFLTLVFQVVPPQQCSACNECRSCRSILVRTPDSRVDIVVNREELLLLKDLLNGIKFRLALNFYVDSTSLN